MIVTTRTTSNWSKVPAFFSSDSYANNRRTGWLYDADGNLTSNVRQYTYDAAGRMTFISGGNTSQFFDGNGQRVKMTEPNVVTYYLRSAVLGQVIAELDGAGTRTAGYIYLGAKLLARQAQNGSIVFEHDDPSRTKLRYTHAQLGNETDAAELDPLGADVYLSDPYLEDIGFEGRGEGFGEFGNVSDPSTGCSVDGLYSPCDIALRLLHQGAAVEAPTKLTRYNRETKRFEFFRAYADGYAGYLPADAQYGSGGTATRFSRYDYTSVTVSDTGQGSGAWHAVFETFALTEAQNIGPNIDDLRSGIAKILKESRGRCAAFIANLINGTSTERNGPEFTDILEGFELVRRQDKFVYGNTTKEHYGLIGATARGSISGGNAQVELPPPWVGNNPTNNPAIAASQTRIQLLAVMHELIHLAGKRGYDDFQLASTVAAMKGTRPADYTGMTPKKAVIQASYNWSEALSLACKPR